MAKKTINEIVEKEYPEFVEDVVGLTVDALKTRLSTYAIELDRSEQAEEADEALQAAKALVSELSGPYRDIKKALKLKRKYIVKLIGEKGGDN